jgi:hypothetical protein
MVGGSVDKQHVLARARQERADRAAYRTRTPDNYR